MRRLFDLILDAWDFFRPLKRGDFGEFGVLIRDGDSFIPMDQAYMDKLKDETDESIKDFFFREEAKAFEIHGEAILRLQ